MLNRALVKAFVVAAFLSQLTYGHSIVKAEEPPPSPPCGFDSFYLSYSACAEGEGGDGDTALPETVCTEVLLRTITNIVDMPTGPIDFPHEGEYQVTCITNGDPSTTQTSTEIRSLAGNILRIPPPPTPEEIAQTVIARLPIPKPAASFAPQTDRLAVNLPIWLWIENPEPVTETETVAGISVTVTATLSTTTWNMGEPINPDNPGQLAAPTVCTGPGTKLEVGADVLNPPCGYTYSWQSLPERTNNTGQWPVQITATWAITWSASTGTAGTDTVSTTSQTSLIIASYDSVLVPDGPR